MIVKELREKIAKECESMEVIDPDPLPVEVWSRTGAHEFNITDVVFDDGVICIEVEEHE